MKRTLYFLVLSAILAVSGCCDTEEFDQAEDFIIFGIMGVYCFEECDHIFKLESDRLLRDTKEEYSGGFYTFKEFEVLPASIFELVKDLGDFIPQELISEPSGEIGEADISDVGWIYFEMKNDTFHQYWIFQRGDYDMPLVYAEFMNKIEEKMDLIL